MSDVSWTTRDLRDARIPDGSVVKNLPEMQKMWFQFLGWDNPLEKEMAAHYSILAWEIPWREEPGRLQSMGSQEYATIY